MKNNIFHDQSSFLNSLSFKIEVCRSLSESAIFSSQHDRTDFKYKASSFFFSKLKNIEDSESHIRGVSWQQAEAYLDAILVEIIGIFNSLLQEINLAFHCNISPKQVCLSSISKIITYLQHQDILTTELEGIRHLKDTKNSWLWQLNEYNNHSKHRSIIPRHIYKSIGSEKEKVRIHLAKDPLDPNSPALEQSVDVYLEETLSSVSQVVSEIYRELAGYLST